MPTITVYDPPMCCSTGVCGPEVDPKLAQLAGDLNWLKSQGVEVRRLNLAQEPASFVENAAVKSLLDRSGSDELPAIVVGDKVVVSGRYPGRDELAAMVGLSGAPTAIEVTEQIKELIALGAARSAQAASPASSSTTIKRASSGFRSTPCAQRSGSARRSRRLRRRAFSASLTG